MQKRLTFIVPVYNVRDYVIRCLTSLVNQNIPATDYEIIVVNDGSPDDSLALVTEFARNYINITILNQENKGLSEARNEGFQLAQSQYVWFVDSDDWITENCLKDLLDIMEEKRLDMFCVAPSIQAQADFKQFFNKETSLSPVLSGKERLIGKGQYFIGVWCYIFRSGFLRTHSLQFFKGIYYEDAEFIPRALFFAERVCLLTHFSVYFYFVRENSICTTVSRKHIFDSLTVAYSLCNFIKNQSISGNLKTIFQQQINSLVLSGLNKIDNLETLQEYLQQARIWKLYPLRELHATVKRQLLLALWNFFPKLAFRFFHRKQNA